MNKGLPVVVERCENGYVVRPFYPPGNAWDLAEFVVFQEMGSTVDQVDTLAWWLNDHFSKPKK